MKIRLKDIIDLEYLVRIDDAPDSKSGINSLARRDREIYSQCKSDSRTRKDLLFAWLAIRKKQFLKDEGKKEVFALPGSSFSFAYSLMRYVMIFAGFLGGIVMAYSFLSYHGTRPVNVALFVFLFVCLPVILMILILLAWVRKKDRPPFFHSLVTAVGFNVLPKLLNQTRLTTFKNALDTLEYTYTFIRMKNAEYQGIFFWPFFTLTSFFAFSFSSGVLGATFFKVLISDMAFGWQSTLVASSMRVHHVVSLMAAPWSWFAPPHVSYPSLEQIEGSRIILKDGIQVLATQDLVSWWPFLCMGLLFYTVIPRGFLILGSILSEKRLLARFDFEHPRFTPLIVRMQSPVLDIDEKNDLAQKMVETPPPKAVTSHFDIPQEDSNPSQKAGLLASKTVYSDAAIQMVTQYLHDHLFVEVDRVIPIMFDEEKDKAAVIGLAAGGIKQVILLHEVWQPPIRGVLYYIKQLKKSLPADTSLWIVLTRDAGQKDLSVDGNDIDFHVWEKAVLKLGDPGIFVKRVLS